MKNNIMRHFVRNGNHKILFCGDDDIHLAAMYLAAVIDDSGYDLDYVPSTLDFPEKMDLRLYSLVIISDYPRERFRKGQLEKVLHYVEEGGSLLMIGGWESFSGLNLEYTDTPLTSVLPVKLYSGDDRVNYDQGIVVLPAESDHAFAQNLDWSAPPLIGGYNRLEAKPGSNLLLKGRKLHISAAGNKIECSVEKEELPLCVSGKYGAGKATALAFDLAPHWIGGMVDWGPKRKRIDFDGEFIEAGNYYVDFVRNLLAISLRENIV